MNKKVKEYIKSDFYRYGKKKNVLSFCKLCIKENALIYSSLMRYYKVYKEENKLIRAFFIKVIKKLIFLHSTIEIPMDIEVGKGLYMGHFSGITINKNAKIGNNVNIHKGVTIGQENRGLRKGTPVIGDRVWIGINSTIVGNITIGNNVLIAPNSFINFDVPSDSIVIGNKIKQCSEATNGYINNIV